MITDVKVNTSTCISNLANDGITIKQEPFIINNIVTPYKTKDLINDIVTSYETKDLKFLNLDIKKVIFNPPATIVFWSDGTKTIVKCMEGDTFDKQTGLAMAICKRIFSEKFHSEFKRWCDKDE